MAPGEIDDSAPEMSTELTRAQRLVSPEFVAAMKSKLKVLAIQRMEAEKQVCDCSSFYRKQQYSRWEL